jgi:hypothetical protein
MSKGLGDLQRTIKRILEMLSRSGEHSAQFQLIGYFFLLQDYDAKDLKKPGPIKKPEDTGEIVLKPHYRRSLRRALTSLIKRGEVVVVDGHGGRRGARYYALAKPAEPAPPTDSEDERTILLRKREELLQKRFEHDHAGMFSNLG